MFSEMARKCMPVFLFFRTYILIMIAFTPKISKAQSNTVLIMPNTLH